MAPMGFILSLDLETGIGWTSSLAVGKCIFNGGGGALLLSLQKGGLEAGQPLNSSSQFLFSFCFVPRRLTHISLLHPFLR